MIASPRTARSGRLGGGGRGSQRGGDSDGDEFGRGRKVSSDDLQLLILALLEAGPAHGYELIRRLEAHSGGFYVPSPGMIYPALAYLDDADQVVAEVLGHRKSYRLAPLGQGRLNDNRDQVERSLSRLARIGSRMDEVRDALTGLHDMDPAFEDLHEARHRLKRALFLKRGCSPQEAARIAAALNRVADAILHSPNPQTPSSRESS